MNFNSLHISRTAGVGLVLSLIVLAAIGYTLMSKDAPEGTITVEGGASTLSEATFVSLATELDAVDFNTAILTDPRFLGLSNIHTAITPEVQGRNDPFSL